MRGRLLNSRSLSLPELAPYANYIFLDMNFGIGKGVKLLDKSPFHSHGDITTAVWANGLHGRCLDFEANNPDTIEIPATHTQLDFTSENFSIIMRIQFEDVTGNRWLFSRYAYNLSGYLFGVTSAGLAEFTTHQSGAIQASRSTAADFTTATWYTLGISRNGTSVRIYKNGVDVTATVGTHTDPATTNLVAKIALAHDGEIEFLRVLGGIAIPAEAHLWYHNALK